MNILYHPGKANMVGDALSRLSIGSAANLEEDNKELTKYVHGLACLGFQLIDSINRRILVKIRLSYH